ncbi:MAG: aminotransferase class V-fold PLP-dependent enzyme [Chloroflexi bacterium]|nr:aminotransferase class V-fold PLP-dependent enzyme [Chloroflexota bacterium]
MLNLKDFFLLDPNIIFLNHGSFGATPKPVFEAYQRWQLELERQPVEFLGRRHNELMRASRATLAEYVGTSENNLVYVTNVTVGLNIVARSLILGPGDEVLTTDHEYGAMDRTWRFLAKEKGFTYTSSQVSLPLSSAAEFVEHLWESVTPQTRVIFISQISSPSALIFPVAEICARARSAGILTVIDGAHVPGQIPLALDSLGADFWSGNLHKWLMSPKGSGFLYARPEVQHFLKPLVVSWGYEAMLPGPSQFVDHHEWMGTRDPAAFLAVPDAIQFQKDHNWDLVREECFKLTTYAQDIICGLTGLPSLHQPGAQTYCQVIAMTLPENTDVVALKTRLYDEYHIEVPVHIWNGTNLIRVSVQGYNTKAEIDALYAALKALLPQTTC